MNAFLPPLHSIFLVGYRGTGKSSVAPLLAARMGNRWEAVDMDVLIQAEAQCSIAEIFAREGEVGFRDREQSTLETLAKGSHRIVATGGGVILREENRKMLRQPGNFVVWLEASVETIARRLDLDHDRKSQRPNLTNLAGIDEIRSLLEQRTRYYEEVADLRISTEETTLDAIASQIFDHVEAHVSRPASEQ